MCGVLVWSFDAFMKIQWLEVAKAAAAIFTAYVAWRALQNWKRQEKAKRKADFLDQLTDAVHAYLGQMPGLVTTVQFVQIGMSAHIPPGEKGEEAELEGARRYMDKRAKDDYKFIADALNAARPAFSKIQSVVAKGQVFKFEGYRFCHFAVTQLAWQFSQAQQLATFMHASNWYWGNPEVLDHLKSLMQIKPEEMQKTIDESNATIHKFLGEAYEETFK